MNGAPLVSAVITTFNTAKYLPEAIDSLLGQDYPSVELIVVDDGSTDETPAVLRHYEDDPRFRSIVQPNRGQEVARNVGISQTSGKFIGFCDADDAWLPHKISSLLPAFSNSIELGVAYGNVEFVNEQKTILDIDYVRGLSGRLTEPLLLDNFVPLNATLIPRDVLDEVGGFDESLRMGADYDLWLRISARYEFRYVDRRVARVRLWSGQMSHKKEERFRSNYEIKKRFIEQHPDLVNPSQARRTWAHFYVTRANWYLTCGRRSRALADFFSAFRRRPYDARLWRNIARVLAKDS